VFDWEWDPRPVRMPGYRPDAPIPRADLAKALGLIRGAARPIILAGQGVIQSGAMRELLEFAERMNTPIATPSWAEPHIVVSAYFSGARLYELDRERPVSTLVWKGNSDSAVDTDKLHSLMAAPVIDGDYVYGFCSEGELRCLRLSTGERVWESQQATVEKTHNVSGFIIRHGDRYFINNDRGELIIAKLSPDGYQEISRTELIKPTTDRGANRRERKAVNWVHPAYANRHIYTRNDNQIIAVPLSTP